MNRMRNSEWGIKKMMKVPGSALEGWIQIDGSAFFIYIQ
jgi:hypothetical protein